MADSGTGQDQIFGGGQGVLGRLLQARDQARVDHGGAAALPRPEPITTTRAAGNAVARAVERLYGLPSSPLELSPSAITLAELGELLPRPALLSVVQGAGDAVGVVAMCPSLMTALIEVQTLGRVTARPVEGRKPTRSDAMICADFVNALLAELGEEMSRIEGFEGFSGFRYASFMDDQRPLLLMLEDGPYRSLRYRLRLGQNPGREGELFLALPQKRAVASTTTPAGIGAQAVARPAERPGTASVQAARGAVQTDPGSGAPLAQQMREAPVDVIGVLCRRHVRLGTLRGLAPGQILPLPRVDLGETSLETRFGQVLAIGKLGEADGFHAIRLRGKNERADSGAVGEKPAPVAVSRGAAASRDRAGKPSSGAETTTPRAADLVVTPADTLVGVIEPPIADLGSPDGFRQADADISGLRGGAGDSVTPQQKSAISG